MQDLPEQTITEYTDQMVAELMDLSGKIGLNVFVYVVKPKNGGKFSLGLGIRMVEPDKKLGGKPFEEVKSFKSGFLEDKLKEGLEGDDKLEKKFHI